MNKLLVLSLTCLFLGNCNLFGQTSDDKYLKLYYELKEKAFEGDLNAMFDIGALYFSGKGVNKDIEKAIDCWTVSGEAGELNSQKALGHYYSIEPITVENYAFAYYWYGLATEQGDMESSYNMAGLYLSQERYRLAAVWYRHSAKNGYAMGQYKLGLLYILGKDIDRDFNKASYWLNKAYKNGVKEAKIELDQYDLWKY